MSCLVYHYKKFYRVLVRTILSSVSQLKGGYKRMAGWGDYIIALLIRIDEKKMKKESNGQMHKELQIAGTDTHIRT